MSRFSGKCDFYDHLCIYCDSEDDIEKILAISDIYILGQDHREYKLAVKTEKDAVKYYPYLITSGSFSNGHHTIVLSSTSFIDREEKERIQYDIDEVKKYWRKCKRNKLKFDIDECYKKVAWSFSNEEYLKDIISRIAENGDKAQFNDIHKLMWEHYRKAWYEEMVRNGYSKIEAFKWCFNVVWPTADITIKRLGGNIYEDEN